MVSSYLLLDLYTMFEDLKRILLLDVGGEMMKKISVILLVLLSFLVY